MFIEVYIVEELDKLNDWIKKILAHNKVMEGLHKDIQRIKKKSSRVIFGSEKVL